MEERSKPRMSSIRIRQQPDSKLNSPRSHPHEFASVTSSIELMLSRMANSLQVQTSRIKNLEHGLVDMLSSKLETLINVGMKINENIARLVDLTDKGLGTTTSIAKVGDGAGGQKLSPNRNTPAKLQKVEEEYNLIPAVLPKQRKKSLQLISVKKISELNIHSPQKPQQQIQQQGTTLLLQTKQVNELKVVTPEYLNSIQSSIILDNDPSEIEKIAEHYTYKNCKSPPIPRPPLTLIYCIKNLIGHYTSNLTEKMYAEYSQGKMLHNQLKAKFSWEIITFLLGLGRSLRVNCFQHGVEFSNTSRSQISGTIDSSFRNILEFLIKKFPPSKHKIVDTELAEHIKEVKRQNQLQYDILRNAGVSFADDIGKSDFLKEIKQWLNKLINEVKRTYPRFKNDMKQLFIGPEGSLLDADADDEIQYEIGSKISETVECYSDSEINEPGLNIKNQQIQRVLVKWAEDLRSTILEADRVIPGNKTGFKSIHGNYAIHLTTARKEELARKIIQILKTKIVPENAQRRDRLLLAVSDVLTLVQLGVEGYEQQSQQQIIALKASQYLDQCSQVFLATTLTSVLQNLNQVRKLYNNNVLEKSVDLITFNVLDILRCRCVGSKQDVKRIYQGLLANKQYQVIRVKNKLNESTRDILINFKPRNSFLICEMQLALGDSKDEINDHFCHYLYELQRSMFPVIFEVASQVVSFDPRVSYFTKSSHPVKFPRIFRYTQLEKMLCCKQNSMHCSYKHPMNLMKFEENNVPFCCALCSRFVSIYHYMIEFLRCNVCGISICPQCIIKHSPGMEEIFMGRYVNFKRIRQFLVPNFQLANSFSTEKQMLPKIKEHLAKHQYLVVYIFAREGIKPYIVKLAESHIISTFFTLDGKILDFRDDRHETWNSILVLSPPEALKLSDLKGYAKLLNDDTPWHELEQLLERRGIDTVVGVRNEQSKEVLVVDVPQRPEEVHAKLQHQLVSRTLRAESGKAEATVELTSKDLTDLSVLNEIGNPATVRSLNLWGNRLTELPDMSTFTSLTELVLRENIIKSIKEVQSLSNLKLLNLKHNHIQGSLPPLPLPQLEALDVSRNRLTDLSGLSKQQYHHLQIIYTVHNELKELPILNCPKLEIFNFDWNHVVSLEPLTKSTLRRITTIQGSHNKIVGRLPIWNFPELKHCELEDNQITDISQLQTSKVPKLETLLLTKNKVLGKLSELSFHRLKVLRLGANEITDISSVEKWELPALEELDLSGNTLIGRLPKMNFPELRQIIISKNTIVDASHLSLSKLGNLQKLDFSSNKLTRLPLLSLLQLTELDLSDNCLESVDRLCQSRLPRLRRLTLSRNRLQGGLPDMDAPHLEELNLDDNDFSSLASLSHRHLLPALKSVSVKQNKKLAGNSQQITMDPNPFLGLTRNPKDCVQHHHFD